MSDDYDKLLSDAVPLTGDEVVEILRREGRKIGKRYARAGSFGLSGSEPASSSGMVLIESGTISSPVEYLDIDLPSGYSHFKIILTNFRWQLNGLFLTRLGAVLSFNGTILNDTNNFDSYYGFLFTRNNTNFGSSSGSDSELIWVAKCDPASDFSPMFIMDLNPGTADNLAQLMMSLTDDDASTVSTGQFMGFVNPDATVTPTPARADMIRFLPYGNGDADPPTSGVMFTAGGSWFLYGVPTP